MTLSKALSQKKFAIYGLGITGISVVNYLRKLGVKEFYVWDDNREKRKYLKKKININIFSEKLNIVDYIVLSPGINIKKTKLKNPLLRNKHKIITDFDLFYIKNPSVRSIVITGTNGKSTTCKIIEHLLKKNGFNTQVGGNIGKSILNMKKRKGTFFIIEASSFQLENSKFIRPKYAFILNISKDHLDWHGSMKKYIRSKFKIFSLQEKNDFAFLKERKFIRLFKKNKNLSKLQTVSSLSYKKIKDKIDNKYLNSKANDENMSFVYKLSKILKIKDKSFLKSFKEFNGLPHRHEIFFKKRKITFINDSKATSFESSKFALQSNSNILWIVGGLPKLKDKFYLNNLKKNIIKSYIIGKHARFFKNQLKGKINFLVSKTLSLALKKIFNEIKNIGSKKEITVLLSPAGASYDQYKNFEERGNEFKKLVKSYGKKFF
tara:strand:+ start:8871 stop:10172 length:1302 start_codon:yes stop_codon:yes gene_type:complete